MPLSPLRVAGFVAELQSLLGSQVYLSAPLALPSTCSPLRRQRKSHTQAQLLLALKALHTHSFGAKAGFCFSNTLIFAISQFKPILAVVDNDKAHTGSSNRWKDWESTQERDAKWPCSCSHTCLKEISNLFCRLYRLPGDRKAPTVPEQC